jgi:hypothetical protein
MTLFSLLLSNLVPCRAEFDRRQFHVTFVVQNGAVLDVFLRVPLFSPISITLRMLHNLTIVHRPGPCLILATDSF